jgi:hypothetical protein
MMKLDFVKKAKKGDEFRKWLVTINNPHDKGLTHELIIEFLTKRRKFEYWRIADHIGKNGTIHTHVYIHYASPALFTALKKRIPSANFQVAIAPSGARKYVFKPGHINPSQSEEIPDERPGTRTDLIKLRDDIKEGVSTFDLIEADGKLMYRVNQIEKYRHIANRERQSKTLRDINVIYIQGSTGVGKTHWVYEKYGFEGVYFVTDYSNPFDEYQGQDVLVLDEFRSQLTISAMLKYLDKFPVELRSRYNNKWACFSTAIIISNDRLEEQYKNIQHEHPETWQAFLHRIHTVRVYTGFCKYEDLTVDDYLARTGILDTHEDDTRLHIMPSRQSRSKVVSITPRPKPKTPTTGAKKRFRPATKKHY